MDLAAPTMSDDFFARKFAERMADVVNKERMADVVNKESDVFVCCSRLDGIRHARVLRSELSVKIGRGCAIGGGTDTATFIQASELFIVLLSKELPTDTNAIFEIWLALQLGLPIVTVVITGAGYDFEAAATARQLAGCLGGQAAGEH